MGELIPTRRYGPASFFASEKALLYVLVTACLAVVCASGFLIWRSLAPGSAEPVAQAVTVEVDMRKASPQMEPPVAVASTELVSPAPVATVTVTPSPVRTSSAARPASPIAGPPAASPSPLVAVASPSPAPVKSAKPAKPVRVATAVKPVKKPAPRVAMSAPPARPVLPAWLRPAAPAAPYTPVAPQAAPEPPAPPPVTATVLTILGRLVHPMPDDGAASISDQVTLVNMRTYQATKGNVQSDGSFTFMGLQPGTRYCLSAWHHRRSAPNTGGPGPGGTFEAKCSWHQALEVSQYGTYTVYLGPQNTDPSYCADTLLPNDLVGRQSSLRRVDLQPVQSQVYR